MFWGGLSLRTVCALGWYTSARFHNGALDMAVFKHSFFPLPLEYSSGPKSASSPLLLLIPLFAHPLLPHSVYSSHLCPPTKNVQIPLLVALSEFTLFSEPWGGPHQALGTSRSAISMDQILFHPCPKQMVFFSLRRCQLFKGSPGMCFCGPASPVMPASRQAWTVHAFLLSWGLACGWWSNDHF